RNSTRRFGLKVTQTRHSRNPLPHELRIDPPAKGGADKWRRIDSKPIVPDLGKPLLIGSIPCLVPRGLDVMDDFIAIDAIGAGVGDHSAIQMSRLRLGRLRGRGKNQIWQTTTIPSPTAARKAM